MGKILDFFTNNGIGGIAKKAVYFILIGALLAFLIGLFVIPNIELPSFIFNFLTGESMREMFKFMTFFVPVKDFLNCFVFIMTLQLALFLWSITLRIIAVFSGGMASD
jgi:hypothetical protein